MAESTTDKAQGSVKDALPTDALRDAGTRLLGLLVQRAAESAAERVTDLSDRLTSVAENGGRGLREALSPDGGRRGEEEGESRPGLLSRGFGALKEKAQDVLGGGGAGGGGKKVKVTVISEDQDIGLPLRTTYDLWTQLGDFPSFMKKLESVEQESDEKTNWKAQVLWSHRTWEATIVEQVPDSHIVWRSKGAKGYADGAVSFTSLGPNLTRVLLVIEYYPQGLFERTGNIWRAQGRRARLEFQHFRRHAMSHVLTRQDEVEGWRGEIRDSEVVTTHEEALEEERGREEQQESPEPRDETAEEAGEDEYADEEGRPEDEEDAYPEDEYADEDEDYEDQDYDEQDDADQDYADQDYDEEIEPDAEDGREPVTASRARRGGNG